MKRAFAILAIIAALVALLPPLRSFADTISSASFLVKDAFVGALGGYASSTNFQVISGGAPIMNGNATSTNFTAATGPVNYSEFSAQSQAWRWYGDAADETPTSSLAGENVAPSNVANAQAIKLRLTIKETSGLVGAGNVKFRLQFSNNSNFSSGVGLVAEIGSCVATSSWCYSSGAGADNATISTKLLSDAGACSGGAGSGCGTHNTSGVSTSSTSTQPAGTAKEYEFTVAASGASPGSTYFFRAVNAADDTPIQANVTSSYPSLVTQGAVLTFAVSGLPQGTNTASLVTDVSTTATGVPFGTLPIGTIRTGAQRLSVSTNATAGYELYVLQDAPLMDERGDAIPPVAASNTSPLPWATACGSGSSACYGYHPTAAVLAGGSTRFAPDDSYAGFTTSTAEVGYSSFPTTSSTLDMVYKMQVSATQINGSYSHNIIYIIAPTF